MKKTDIKNSKLKISNKKIIKESWADAAASSMTSGEWLKIATTALKGAQAFLKRSWNTTFVLPWKMFFAIKNGESLEDVMNDWERDDKKFKEDQKRIIDQTGVQDTVNAFVGVCNPGALLGQAWCDYTDRDGMKERWAEGSADVWNKTFARNNPDLQIKINKDSKKFNSQIVFSNFIKRICSLIDVKNDVSYYDDFREFEKSKKKWSQYVSVSNSLARENKKVRLFFQYLIDLKSDNTVFKGKETYSKYLVNQSIGDEKIKSIENDFFKIISEKGMTSIRAGNIILANDFAKELDKIAHFIENATGIKASFEKYMKSSSRKTSTSTEETTPVSDSVRENIQNKSMTIFNKNIIIENENKVSFEKFAKKYYNNLGSFVCLQNRFVSGVRLMLINELALITISNSYFVYKDLIEKLANKNSITDLKNNDTLLSKKVKLLEMLERVELFIDKMKAVDSKVQIEKIDKDLFSSLKQEDKTASIAIKEFKKNLEDLNKNLMDNELVSSIISEIAKSNLNYESEEESSREDIEKEIERIKLAIGNEDRLKMAYELVAGTVYKFWLDSANDNTLEDQKTQLEKTKNNFIKVQSLSNNVCTDTLTNALSDSAILNIYDNIDLTDIIKYYNTTISGDFTSSIDNLIQQPYDSLIEKTRETIKELLLSKKEKGIQSDSEDDNKDLINIGSDYSNAVVKVETK